MIGTSAMAYLPGVRIMLTFSLIIPVYNEERHIRACLDAVAAQTVAPDEVIVVDNNCTDTTISIAREYGFVTVLHEPAQGRGHARSAGFDAAGSELLGRIDADSHIDPDWVARAKSAFADSAELAGLTGLGRTVLLPGVNFLHSTLFTRGYFWIARAHFNTVTMWGANMAIRQVWWQRVRGDVCLDDAIVHEDIDISLCIAARGAHIRELPQLRITTNGQGYRYLPKALTYLRLFRDTRRIHLRAGAYDSAQLRTIGFWRTLAGRLAAYPLAAGIIVVATLLFPVDYVVNKYWPNSWWLD